MDLHYICIQSMVMVRYLLTFQIFLREFFLESHMDYAIHLLKIKTPIP